MEKIYTTRISQKGRKCTKPELPTDPASRKVSQEIKKNETAQAKSKSRTKPKQNKIDAKRRV